MAVPRSRVSNARKNTRRAHHAKKHPAIATCTNCKKDKRHHAMCLHCGHYKGRSYLPEQE